MFSTFTPNETLKFQKYIEYLTYLSVETLKMQTITYLYPFCQLSSNKKTKIKKDP